MIPLIPLRDLIVYPQMQQIIPVARTKSINAIDTATINGTNILLVLQKDPSISEITKNDMYSIGVEAEIVNTRTNEFGVVELTVVGVKIVTLSNIVDKNTHFEAKGLPLKDTKHLSQKDEDTLFALINEQYIDLAKYTRSLSVLSDAYSIGQAQNLTQLVYVVATVLALKTEDRQALLEMRSLEDRASFVSKTILQMTEAEEAKTRIENNIKSQMQKNQKEYYLREQLESIQKELGEKDDDLSEYEKKINTKKLSKEARERVNKEMKKLKALNPMMAESGVIRNYLDQILSLPWGEYSTDNYDLKNAETILERDNYGMKDTKERILEQIAIMNTAPNGAAPIICLYGPPGVGKTSISKSVADALGKQFTRISLGGVRDESEIRGHRRTYVGAMPGKILSALKKLNTSNPVILLDEIDKMGSDQRGDPASAMLEVLDPAQNATFVDHFLDLEYDLSRVTFICTANDISKIPRPLLDRMEMIEVDSYIPSEKLAIAKTHLIPKKIKEFQLEKYNISFTDEAIQLVIDGYTRESGVRNLERKLSSIMRKTVKNILNGKKQAKKITPRDVKELLDEPTVKATMIEKKNPVGMTNGLAWTQVGGDILPVEVVTMPGKGDVVVTGSLGDVMKESTKTALTVVKTLLKRYKVANDYFTKNDLHIHFPDGATPKDGPSAGITIVTSIMSAITGRAVRRDIAMTGEVSIRGRVMPIGGLKEKVLAAHRGGVKKVVIPVENKKDLKDIPEEVKGDLQIVATDDILVVLKESLI